MDDVFKFLDSNINVINNDYIVVAVSGGIDSMALLYLLRQYYPNLHIVCAHVHHNVRKESDEEALFVKSFCKNNNIIFEMFKIDKYHNNHFTEKEAREYRYQFLENIVNKYKSNYLFTAHHGDDLIETVLMKIVRGSNFYGYRGFSAISNRNNYQIIRPFIYISKDIIKQYVIANSISYREDISNNSLEYTRNRYRHQIIPLLRDINNNLIDNFLMFNKNIEEYSQFVEEYVLSIIDKYGWYDKINISELNKLSLFLQKQVIFYFLSTMYKDNLNRITNKHINNILLLLNNDKVNCYINLPDSYLCVKEYNYLYIKKEDRVVDYKIKLDKDIILSNGKKIIFLLESKKGDNNIIYIDSSKIELPIYVRNRKDGDKIVVKNLNHHKKVKDIFIENKVPICERNNWPIVVDSQDRIIWIPGLKKSNLDSQNSGKYDIILEYT